MQYGIRWEVLAAINEIETDYGRNLNVSSAGALGWMQFMPATWKHVRRRRQPATASRTRSTRSTRSSPPRATCSAAGADKDLRRAIFAYNHADWYVDSRADARPGHRRPAGRPRRLAHRPHAGPLPGPRQGDLRRRAQEGRPQDARRDQRRRDRRVRRDAAAASRSTPSAGAPGDRRQRRPGRQARPRASASAATSMLQDVYGNTYTYAHLGDGRQDLPGAEAAHGARPRSARARPAQAPRPASRRADDRARAGRRARRRAAAKPRRAADAPRASRRAAAVPAKERLFAHPDAPERPRRRRRRPARRAAGDSPPPAPRSASTRSDFVAKPLRKGARVIGGTMLGRIGKTTPSKAPHLLLRDPPGRPRRPAHRPEADPRRLEAARVDRDLPRQGQEPVLRRRRRRARRSARSC